MYNSRGTASLSSISEADINYRDHILISNIYALFHVYQDLFYF